MPKNAQVSELDELNAGESHSGYTPEIGRRRGKLLIYAVNLSGKRTAGPSRIARSVHPLPCGTDKP